MKNWIQKILGTARTTRPASPPTPSQPSPTTPPPERVTVRKPATPTPPAPTPKRNPVKDKLYGDLPLDQWPPPGANITESPWSDFAAARHHLEAGRKGLAITHWRAVLATPQLESLHYVQAWFFLRHNEVRPTDEEAYKIFGVVAENGPSGVLIAAFEDGQARLYSDNGQGIVWGRPDDSFDQLIVSLLTISWKIVETTKPWKSAHIALPKSNINSISVLTPSGIYMKTGAPQAFENDPIIKPIANQLALLTRALMEKAGEAK